MLFVPVLNWSFSYDSSRLALAFFAAAPGRFGVRAHPGVLYLPLKTMQTHVNEVADSYVGQFSEILAGH